MIITGDSLIELKRFEDSSIDSLVTDPPAGIAFMGKQWDTKDTFQQQMHAIFEECLRVLKPGSHGFVWALPRTSHWTASALEEAGFEIRDVVTHIFGSGFPKSHNVGNGWGSALKPASEHWILVRKPLEKGLTIAQNVLKFGTGAINIDASRIGNEEIQSNYYPGQGPFPQEIESGNYGSTKHNGRFPANFMLSHHPECEEVGTRKVKGGIAIGENKNPKNSIFGTGGDFQSAGFADEDGTETIPRFECHPECPVSELDRQSGNLSKPGNIPGKTYRIGQGDNVVFSSRGLEVDGAAQNYGDTGGASRFFKCHKECPVAELDRQSGNIKSVGGSYVNECPTTGMFPVPGNRGRRTDQYAGEQGGASRFFYCAKPSKSERNAGLEDFPEQDWVQFQTGGGKSGKPSSISEGRNTKYRNIHPTVKPTKLMKYLIQMICPPGGTVLDPFAGSCTTGVAAVLTKREPILIEREAEYVEIGEARLKEARGENEKQNRLFQ